MDALAVVEATFYANQQNACSCKTSCDLDLKCVVSMKTLSKEELGGLPTNNLEAEKDLAVLESV